MAPQQGVQSLWYPDGVRRWYRSRSRLRRCLRQRGRIQERLNLKFANRFPDIHADPLLLATAGL